jgi:DNA-directed RNA polymerase I, II, and III subunit RPABC1
MEVLGCMLKIRNYKVDSTLGTSEVYLTSKVDNENDKIYVFFPGVNTKVGVFTIRQYIKDMKDNNVSRAIIIVKDAITSFARQVFAEETKLIIEHFRENELLVDKLKHVLVPKHELISSEEKKELLKIYGIKDIHLPKMLSSDAIAKYFGALKGEVFKITRVSETGGEYIYYRIVV